MFADSFRGRRVLITGHTGFKGSWLTAWLHRLGAKIFGLALPAETTPNHISQLRFPMREALIDIRDQDRVRDFIQDVQPEIVFHLAAQPLVRRSYQQPIETWNTNVLGTCHVLNACRSVECLKAILVVTTDKCYENHESGRPFREEDRLGGFDPYSASKAATEILVNSYRLSFFSGEGSALLATGRAGNVIGGGDWSEDRLIPDVVRAIERREAIEIRSPKSTRPWQHVLESLSGYMSLVSKLCTGEVGFDEAWNFGPTSDGNLSVEAVLHGLQKHWPELQWKLATSIQPHEAGFLSLDSSKARSRLGWDTVWPIDVALEKTADWYRRFSSTGEAITLKQIEEYESEAASRKISWAS